MQSKYISTNRSKHYLKCHLILVTKYRRNILVGQLNDDLKDIFSSIANNSDFEIEVFESDVNHIHFLIRYIPRLSISQLVRRLKQESTRQLWLSHHATLRQYYWYQKLSINKLYPYIIFAIWVCCHYIFWVKFFTRI